MNGLPEIRLSAGAHVAGHWLPRPHEADWLDLDAPYQRGSVWTVDQQRALIKSLYMGVPVGAVVTSVLPYRDGSPFHLRVVDGKQRIEAVRAFAAGRFTIPYSWLRDEDRPMTHNDDGQVWYPDASGLFQRHLTMSWQMPSLEFNGQREYLGRGDDGVHQYRRRSDAELLAAEADIYGLINAAGTPQTDADLARAAAIAKVRR